MASTKGTTGQKLGTPKNGYTVSNIAPHDWFFVEYIPAKDILRTPIEVVLFELKEGKYGRYTLIHGKNLDTQETVTIICGGSIVCKQVDQLMQVSYTGMKMMLDLSGRAFILVDVSDDDTPL